MLCSQPIGPIPGETLRVAHAAFPHGNIYVRLAAELGTLFTDDLFANLYPNLGQPALTPWRLALVTILQFAEGLSDRQAADAVRSRIDWKCLLRLELTDPGFDASILCEFRGRLIEGACESVLLETLLTWCRQRKLLRARGSQRTDSTHILAAVRALNRVEVVQETMHHALNRLAIVAPEWLIGINQPNWVERYGRRASDGRLPASREAREALAFAIGRDGLLLLNAVYADSAPSWLRDIPAVQILRRVWIQQFTVVDGAFRWRGDVEGIPPSSLFISSPYDLDAHYAKKNTTQWVGYKIHLTETCDDDLPHLITHVETTAGPVADGDVTPTVHADLKARDLLPSPHLVDTGYLDAQLLVESRANYDVELFGPTRADYHWQARAGEGFDAEHFSVDWDRQRATCPAGCTSLSWTPAIDKRDNEVIKVKFSYKDCTACVSRESCVRSKKTYQRRTLTVRTQPQYEALRAARQREGTPEFAAVYARRAGIEGTISRGVRTCEMRRTRYCGLTKVRLGHLLTAVGLNFLRLGEWFQAVPPPKTRYSPFAKLMASQPLAA